MSIKKTWFSVVKPALAATITVFLAAGAVNADADVQKAQRLLNALGFDAGSVDGQWGKKSQTALSEFLISQNQTFDGTLDQTELDVLQSAATAKNIPTKPLSGVEMENKNLNFEYAPVSPGKMYQKYLWAETWFQADWNNDSLTDFLYVGAMRPDNVNPVGVNTGGACGNKKCIGKMPGPTLFLQSSDGFFYDRSSLFVDKRETPGQSLSRQTLVGDLNVDGILDLFIADTGLGTHDGFRDSYFLSQSDGTWLESSDSHLSDPNLVIFDHGGAIGDIDEDGDLDIVLTELKNSLTCWMNSGDGHLKKRHCGPINAGGIELADMDGDGDLDLIHAGDESEGFSSPTGIAWNDGYGKFSGNLKLPVVEDFPGVLEVSAWDLDSDDDTDIILSRVGKLYVGTGIQMLENQGGNHFKSSFYSLVTAPEDYIPTHEGNEWNNAVGAVRFSDIDNDGLVDIALIGGGLNEHSLRVRGAFLKNLGGMEFKHIIGNASDNPIKILSTSKFRDGVIKRVSQVEIDKNTINSNKKFLFEKQLLKSQKLLDDSNNFSSLSMEVKLAKSNGVVLGYSNYSHPSYLKNKFRVTLLVQFGEAKTSVPICVELHANNFVGVSGTIDSEHFNGIFSNALMERGDCVFSGGDISRVSADVSELLKKYDIPAIYDDLQRVWPRIIKNMVDLPEGEREKVLADFQ